MPNKAILYGVNDYATISDLRGCLNDVVTISKLLTEVFGFDEQNIKRYTNEAVDKARIREGFEWLIDGVQEGDRLVFHFSGHGSYLPSHDVEEEVDELLCLHKMDWDNPDTYLLDDELGEILNKIPAGAMLTVILDCCHSGTGTRLVNAQGPKTPLLVLLPTISKLAKRDAGQTVVNLLQNLSNEKLQLDSKDQIIARFIHPPESSKRKHANRKIRKFGRSLERSGLNHQLLAACSDQQTAADAYIEGDYHGAFSFYLAKSSTSLGQHVSAREVIDEIIEQIKDEYSQTPQIEGPYSDLPLFGASRGDPNPVSGDSTQYQNLCSLGDSAIQQDSQTLSTGTESLDNLINLAGKFLDLANRISSRAIHLATQKAPPRKLSEVVVYVHGISQHRSGYSNDWWNAMSPYITIPLTKAEVVWSDIVNPRTAELRLRSIEKNPRAVSLRAAVEEEIRQRIESERIGMHEGMRSKTRVAQLIRGNGLSLDDFIRYMVDESVRTQILQRFIGIVRPLLDDGITVHIVSHSWGTVVAYEGLRQLERNSLSGRVTNFFVVGSALSIRAVQSNLFERVQGGSKPDVVDQIINLDAAGDPVGGSIASSFEVHREHIGLKPVGCATIPTTNTAINPICAHGSYFRAANRVVSKDIFARRINDAT